MQDILINQALNSSQPVAWFAPTYRMLLDNWRQVRHTLAPVTVRANDSEHRLELITGSVIDMWSLDSHDAARGRKYALVCINEAAMIQRLQESWEMVIRPTLADYLGSAFFASTPKGINYFYMLCQQAETQGDWATFHYRTKDNPHIATQEIDEMRAMLPERVFKQEIEAEFITDGSYFQNVDQCAVLDAPDAPEQHAGHALVGGVDWAKSNDFTVITIGCRDCRRVVDWARFNQIDYRLQRDRLMGYHRKWRVSHWLVESNSIGEPNLEELQYDSLPVTGFQTTATTKPPLIEALNLSFVQDAFKVPREYGDELRAYEIISNSGRTRFSAPAGMHDDTVISLALCNMAISTARPMVLFGGDDE